MQNLPYLVRKMNNVLFHPAAYSSGNDLTEDVLVAEINRLLDAIALHRREHTGGPYCWRDRKLYAAIGFTPPAPASAEWCEADSSKPRAK